MDAMSSEHCEQAINLTILGSSGSIGKQTLDVAEKHSDKVNVTALSVNSNVELLVEQARKFNVKAVAIADESNRAHNALLDLPSDVDVLWGAKGVEELAAMSNEYQSVRTSGVSDTQTDHKSQPQTSRSQTYNPQTQTPDPQPQTPAPRNCQLSQNVVLNSLVGFAGLRASYCALKSGSRLALANKESLVVGGDLLIPMAAPDQLIPVDSEHSAIFQCLAGESSLEVSKLWITASGGPFRGYSRDQLKKVTRKDALAHPTWNMGPKITIDSSTLMNKGLEVIEAYHLFGFGMDKIEVVVHPQSCIHSMVEYIDGSVKAHLGVTDMRIPIQLALSYPSRWQSVTNTIDFRKLKDLTFEAPDTHTFGCLALALEAGRTGGSAPAVLNAANEIAVGAFLSEKCEYLDIEQTVREALKAHEVQEVESLDQLEEIDAWARKYAQRYLRLDV